MPSSHTNVSYLLFFATLTFFKTLAPDHLKIFISFLNPVVARFLALVFVHLTFVTGAVNPKGLLPTRPTIPQHPCPTQRVRSAGIPRQTTQRHRRQYIFAYLLSYVFSLPFSFPRKRYLSM